MKNVQFIFFLVSIFLLQSCASSNVSRSSEKAVNSVYSGTDSSITGLTQSSMVDTYQNSSQTSKGVIIGGVTGGVIGGFTNGIGVVAGSVTGAILGGALGAYIDANTTLVDKLNNRGVKVFVLGDQVMIVLPSSKVFYEMTPTIKTSAYSTLNLVSELIGSYVNMTVKVSAYTNASGPERVSYVLSKEQAEHVATYLWRHGVNTRLLYAEGCGGRNLVEANSLDWSKSMNYRVEITLEKLPA